jgi:hypothetical protein
MFVITPASHLMENLVTLKHKISSMLLNVLPIGQLAVVAGPLSMER